MDKHVLIDNNMVKKMHRGYAGSKGCNLALSIKGKYPLTSTHLLRAKSKPHPCTKSFYKII